MLNKLITHHTKGDAPPIKILGNIVMQSGVTLISLLIGMTISLICISGCLVLYKNLIKVAGDTQSNAIYDGQLASVLLTAQLEMQNAGYGIVNNGVANVATALVSGNANIYWRYSLNNTVVCRGLRDAAVDSNTRTLQLISASGTDCTVTANLTAITWDQVTDTLGQFKQLPAPSVATPILTAVIGSQNCWPYGAGLKSAHSVVVITASSAMQVAGNTSGTTYQFCLPNT